MKKLWFLLAILFSHAALAQTQEPTELPGCIYNLVAPTLADGQQVILQCDVNGNLKTTGGGGGGGSPGGSNGQVQYNNAGSFGGITGATTNGTTLTLVAPILGTPASGTLTNATGLPITTGVSGLGANVATFLATPSSANLAGALTDETGTGVAVFAITPTLVTPVLGVATATSVNKVAITAPATSATLTIPDGVTLTGPAASGTAMTLGNAEAVSGIKTFATGQIVNGTLRLGTVSSVTGQLLLANSASANLTTIQAGNAAAARTYTWPTNFGAAGTVLTDAAGNGTLSWAAAGGGITEPLTLTRLLTITQGTANEGILASTGYSLTGSNATNMVDLGGTWNTSGAPIALKVNITNTASDAASLLAAFQVGGSTRVGVRVGTGYPLRIASGTPDYTSDSYIELGSYYGVIIAQNGAGTAAMRLGPVDVSLPSNGVFGFASTPTGAVGTGSDTMLWRDAAGIFAQRNSTNAQTSRVYNTYTDASNYERGVFDWTTTANTLTIGTQKAGTGATRGINVTVGGSTIEALDASGSTVTGTLIVSSNINAGAGSYIYWAGSTLMSAPTSGSIQFSAFGSNPVTLTAKTATLQLGDADAASPVAQTLATQGSRAATDSNVGGANLTVQAGLGTGTGTLSSLILRSPILVGSGTGAQTATTGLTIKGGMAVTVGYAVASLPTGITGGRTHVTDQLTSCPILGGTFTGGGAVICSAFYNGTAWVHE